MRVIVTGRNIKVSRNLKEQAVGKLEKVQRILDRVQTLEIEFSEEHNPRISDRHQVEVTMTTKAHVLRAHAAASEPMAAIDKVVPKLQRQVRRLKEKKVDRAHGTPKGGHAVRPKASGSTRGARVKTVKGTKTRAAAVGDLGLSENGHPVGLESPGRDGRGAPAPVITEVKRFTLKPMTAEEAVLQMESLERDFFLFLDAESEQAGVVYRRADGSFGLIEPE